MTGDGTVWEYLTIGGGADRSLTQLGRAGWELVAVTEHNGAETFYFKRPARTLRERVTLDQKARYYARLGLPLTDHAEEER